MNLIADVKITVSRLSLNYLLIFLLIMCLSSSVSTDGRNRREKKATLNPQSGDKVKDIVSANTQKKTTIVPSPTTKIPSTTTNSTNEKAKGTTFGKLSPNSDMLFRAMCVLLAVTGIAVIYFIVKSIRLRRRKSKSRKYGIITKQGDRGGLEMEPLGDGMDEDDDYTVFEMNRRN